jgi:glycosyltransferase involved in cell wall biosynthesis
MADPKVKGVIAYGLTPYAGGPTTVYRLLARGLRALGWKVFSVAVGQRAARCHDPNFCGDSSVILAPAETSLTGQVQAFLDWVNQEKVDVVIPNSQDNIVAAIPHLPSKVRYISVCHTISRGAYCLCRIHLERLSFVVAISERQMQDLEQGWRVPRTKLRLIPHGIEYEKFFQGPRLRNDCQNLRLIYLGRLHDVDKGVMWLPPILREASNREVPCTMDLVGEGPDLAELQNRFASSGLSGRVQFLGNRLPGEIPPILAHADIFLLPSRFEGFGLTLVEAMAAGCVPIATHLQGITDMIVEDGVSGFLCPLGQVKAFADKIALLHRDRERLRQMAAAAQRRVQEKFTLARMAADYDRLFTEALAQPPIDYQVRPLEQLEYPRELSPTWRACVPQPIKNLARRFLYRCFDYVP